MLLKDVPEKVKFYFLPVERAETEYYRENGKLYWQSSYKNSIDSTSEKDYLYRSVQLVNSFDFVTAAQKLKEGKKIRNKNWISNNYYVIDDKGGIKDKLGFFGQLHTLNVLELTWEEYTGPEVEEVKLNNEYNAVVSTQGIKVGCQEFSFEKLDELVKTASKFRK